MAYAFSPILDQASAGLRRADLQTWRVLVFSLLKVPLPLLFVGWVTGPLGGRLGAFLSIAVAAGVSVLVMGFVFLPRVLPGYRPKPRLSRRRLRPMFLFSVGNWVAAVVASASVLLLPILVLNTLGAAGAEAAAFFYAAVTIAGLLYIIPNATLTSFLAEASQHNARRRRDERKAILLSLGLLLPGIIGMWFLAGILLALMSRPEYVAQGTGPLRILIFASVPVFLNGIFGTRIRIKKQTWPLIIAAFVETGVTLVLGYVLLVQMGLDGLAYAFVAAQAAGTPILWMTAGAPTEAEPVEPTPAPP
jgi:O-antigen/teichoic acid export membrane protein